jgi:hypothetical protein
VIITSTPAAGVLLIAIDGRRRRNALNLAGFRSLAAAWRTLETAEGSATFREKQPPAWRLT